MRSFLRQVLILGVLLGLIWFAELLQSAAGSSRADRLAPGAVAMALGFALLAAHLFGRLLGAIDLPAITGYLLAGVLLGPHLLGFVGLEVKERLTLINQIALGMIALTAGGELAIERIRPRLRSIGWITALQTLVLFGATTGLVVLLGQGSERWGWEPALTAGLSPSQVIAAGLVLGLVAVANSPASTVAVIAETRARGPLTTVSIGVTVLKDVVVILLLSITLALAGTLVEPGASFAAGTLVWVLAEIVSSLAIGGALGAAIIAWLARVRRESAFFLLGAIFLTLEGGHLLEDATGLHVHFLVVCMTAGFAVENLSSRGEELIRGLERSALPVYVVFFTLAGVGLDLGALRLLWPIAVGFFLWRAGLLAITTWVGARVGQERRQVGSLAWTSFLAQAGVSIGLAALVAQRYPQLGERVGTLILAVIAINQLVGPVLFKWTLRQVGEAGRAQMEEAPETTTNPFAPVAPSDAEST